MHRTIPIGKTRGFYTEPMSAPTLAVETTVRNEPERVYCKLRPEARGFECKRLIALADVFFSNSLEYRKE